MVYNGTRKLVADSLNFMGIEQVKKCIESIKMKNSEGFDRIPQRVLVDGIDYLLLPVSKLFEIIYKEKAIPEQWRLSKIICVHKKGSKHLTENYDVTKIIVKFNADMVYLHRVDKMHSEWVP